MIQWWFFAIGSVIFKTLFSIFRKKALCKTHAMNFESLRSLIVVIISLSLIPFIDFSIEKSTLIWIFFLSLISVIGILYVSKAYKHAEISSIEPLDNFRAAFVAILAFIFLSESITTKQIIGMSILIISAYLLESDHHFSNLLTPIKNLFKSRYNLYFLLGTLIFAVGSTIEKYLISSKSTNIYTLFFFVWVFVAINFNLVHGFVYGFTDTIRCFRKTKYLVIIVALFSVISNLLAYKALSMTYVSLLIPILTLSTLFVVLFGGRFFHEKYLFFRISISLLMIIGAILIAT